MNVRCMALTDWPSEFESVTGWTDPFRSTWGDTLSLLERELEKLGATEVVIEAPFRDGDIRIDGWPRANARPAGVGVIVSFDSKHGPLRYGTAKFPNWQSNVRAIALGLEALRKVDRYGISRRGEQYTGWKQLSAPDSDLVLRGRELIAEYGGETAALKATHPDHGGDGDDFRAVNAAR